MTTPGEGRTGYEKYFTGGLHTLTATSTKEDIKVCYDKWADAYDEDLHAASCVKHKPMVEVFDRAVREAMPGKPKSEVRIMDMGAGTGLLGVELNKIGYTNVDALDVSQRMLEESRKKGVYTEFICTHLTEKPTPEIETGQYNAIISSGVVTAAYGHIRPPCFIEMMRTVADSGVIYFNVRTKEIPDFRPSMMELQKQGLWTLIKEEEVPHYNNDDPALPKTTTVFAFKVHHHKNCIKQKTTPGEGRTGYEKYFTGGLHTLTATSTKEDIIVCYDKWADAYDEDLHAASCVKHKPMVEVFDRAVKEAMPGKPKSEVRIMDMGAGTGLLGVELNKIGYTNVDALDVSQRMLEESRKKGVYTEFICTHLTEKPTPEIETGQYNAIISSGVVTAAYGHIRPPCFIEMMRTVADCGVIYFNVRTKEIPDFRPSMMELQKQGLWTLIKEEEVPHYNNDDPALPKTTTVFAFKVHHHKNCTK